VGIVVSWLVCPHFSLIAYFKSRDHLTIIKHGSHSKKVEVAWKLENSFCFVLEQIINSYLILYFTSLIFF
jgi:hypothetical protein